jgi:hypothetical protein
MKSRFWYSVKVILLCLFLVPIFSSGAKAASLADLPPKVLLAGVDDPVATGELLTVRPLLVVVGSHKTVGLLDRLPLRWLARGWALQPEQFLGVAAVSKAPWLVKVFLLRGSLTQAKKDRDELAAGKIPGLERSEVIIDQDGEMVKALGLADLGKRGYAAFVIDGSDTIESIVRAELPDGVDEEQNLIGAADRILDNGAGYFSGK